MNTTKWVIDPTHSEIGFKVKHMMFTNVSGRFDKYEGTFMTDGDNFEGAEISFSADIDSINTGNADRDNHLKGADFFDGGQFPTLSFKSSSFSKKGGSDYELAGDLSLHGVTKFVKLPVEFGGLMTDPWGNSKAAMSISGTISRKEWGLNWNAALETGGVLVSDDVKLHIELQLLKQA
jgi:polyisoprenoid-binding protein YceI